METSIEIQLKNSLEKLESFKEIILKIGENNFFAYKGIYLFDIYCTAILNKTLNILFGYISLTRANNYISAVALVRIHLDTLLRIFAPHASGINIDEFAKLVIDGNSIDKLKDKVGNRLTDSFLAKELSKWDNFEWVHDVYLAGNKFVHFSENHIFTSTKINNDEPKMFDSIIGLNDNFLTTEFKIEGTKYVEKITIGIIYFIQSWIEQKKSYNKL